MYQAGARSGLLLALCRREGRPTEADREMWRTLRVVFNRDEAWSMRAEDSSAVRAAGRRRSGWADIDRWVTYAG